MFYRTVESEFYYLVESPQRKEGPMRDIDAVWRTLADQALAGRRDWQNAADLAHEAGVGEKLNYKALAKPVSIGAVTRYSGGGFSAVDPEPVSYTHLRPHETDSYLVCRLLL